MEKPFILIIDDEEGTLKSLEFILRDFYQVLTATKGSQGIEILKTQPIDMVLTDIHMPDMTGLEVLKQAKQADPLLEVVMITGYAKLETAKTALRLGALDYIHKPFEPSQILDIVKEGLEKRRKGKETLEKLDHLENENGALEKQLLLSERAVSAGQMSSSVVHEISNPLMIIQGYVDLMMKKLNKNGAVNEKDHEDHRKYLAAVEGQIHQCRNIAMDFLQFVRGNKNETHALQLNLMIEECAEMFRKNSMARRIKIEVHTDKKVSEVSVNIGLIRQVFVNLIVNALHAMPINGTLTLETHKKEEGVEVCVKDTGKGIAPENLEKIFQTFFTTKEGGKGSGLGLSISKQIIEKHGGHISLQSKVGKGTTFTIYLPSKAAHLTQQRVGAE